ncbi:peptidylprolyl isomerase [bacterium]|nr:peptidylprolyl isomerase [bacterium]
MNTKKLLATAAISAILLTGCGFKGKDAIVIVNDKPITEAQFDETLGAMTNNQINRQNPIFFIMKDRIVNELIVRELLNQEIAKRQITVSAEEEEAALKDIIDRYGSKEQLQKVLKENGISEQKFKKDLNNELKMKKLIAMLGKVEVSDAEVKKFYKENPDKFKTPEKVRASHILISANPKEIERLIASDKANSGLSKEEIAKKVQEEMTAKKAEAEKLLAQVKNNPKGFEQYAREHSEDVASGQKGGDLGFFAYEDMVEPFSKAAFALKPNKVSDLVQSDYGYHIIIVKDRAKASKTTFDKAKDDIKQYLITEKQVKLLDDLIVNLKNNAKIEYVKDEFKPDKIKENIKDELKK